MISFQNFIQSPILGKKNVSHSLEVVPIISSTFLDEQDEKNRRGGPIARISALA